MPINPPIYRKKLKEKRFVILFQEDLYDMLALRMNTHKDKKSIKMGINEGDHEKDFFFFLERLLGN